MLSPVVSRYGDFAYTILSTSTVFRNKMRKTLQFIVQNAKAGLADRFLFCPLALSEHNRTVIMSR